MHFLCTAIYEYNYTEMSASRAPGLRRARAAVHLCNAFHFIFRLVRKINIYYSSCIYVLFSMRMCVLAKNSARTLSDAG